MKKVEESGCRELSVTEAIIRKQIEEEMEKYITERVVKKVCTF